MQPLYRKDIFIPASATDQFDRLKLSQLLRLLQEVSADHCALLGADRQSLEHHRLFWAVLRHRVQITQLPHAGQTITLETWPMPTTRTAYPRAACAYDENGNVLFRCISLWVLMEETLRTMVLPGQSGITVPGTLRGGELALPGAMALKPAADCQRRTVRFSDLDSNGHMNNCRYLDWVADTLPGSFHRENPVREFSVCYLSEAWENDTLDVNWALTEEGILCVDALRTGEVSAGHGRVFSARVQF